MLAGGLKLVKFEFNIQTRWLSFEIGQQMTKFSKQ